MQDASRRDTEGRRAIAFGALAFCVVGLPTLFTNTAAFTLFVEHFGARYIPYTYIAAALFVPLAGLAYFRLEARLSFRRLLLTTLAVNLGALVSLRIGLALPDPRWAIAAATVWVEIEWVIVSLVFWGLAERVFTLREAKRLFAPIGAGEPLAVLVGGLCVPLIVEAASVADLLWCSAAGTVAGLVVIGRMDLSERPRSDAVAGARTSETANGEDESDRGARRRGSRPMRRYLLAVVSVAVVASMVHFALDNAFYDLAGRRYADEQDLARFVGVFFAGVGAVTLLGNLLVGGWLLRRGGLRAGLLALPLLLLLATAGAWSFGLVAGWAGALFAFGAAAKLVEESVKIGVHQPAFLMLYQPLEPRLRTRAQALIEAFAEPIAGAAAGLILVLAALHAGLSASELFGLVSLLVILWLGLASWVCRAYLRTVESIVAARRVEDTALSLEDPVALRAVEAGLESPRVSERVYCLHLLHGADRLPPSTLLAGMLSDPDPVARRELATVIERRAPADLGPALLDALSRETDREVRAALLRAAPALGDDALLEAVLAALSSPDRSVRTGAMIGLLKHGGIEGVLAAGEPFIALARSPRRVERALAARVLGEVGVPAFHRPLLALLRDPVLDVRRAALRAAATVNAPGLWPLLVAALDEPALRPAATAALSACGPPVLPDLVQAFEAPGVDDDVKAELLGVVARIDGHRASALLESKVTTLDDSLEQPALAALVATGYTVRGRAAAVFEHRLERACTQAASVSACLVDVQALECESAGLLRSALERELALIQERTWSLLCVLFHAPMSHVSWRSLRGAEPQSLAYALEVVEARLGARWRGRCLHVLEPMSHAARWRSLRNGSSEETMGADARVMQLAAEGGPSRSDWVRACALHAIGEARSATALTTVESALDSPAPVVRETAAWALARFDGERARAALVPLCADRDIHVAGVAQELLYQLTGPLDAPALDG